MSFESELRKKLLESVSESTADLYIKNLRKLNGNESLANLNFLRGVKEVVDTISSYKLSTKATIIAGILKIMPLMGMSDKRLYKKPYQMYKAMHEEMSKERKVQNSSGVKSEAQEKNWIAWDEVNSIHQKLAQRVAKFAGKAKLDVHEYNVLLEYLVLSLYVLLPPRRNMDYSFMKVSSSKDDDGFDANYYREKDGMFVFNKYKTAKKHGQESIEVPGPLKEIISTYLRFKPESEWFLVDYTGKPLQQVNSITRILNKVFGKKVGASMLRHIFITEKLGDKYKELEETAKDMGHSMGQQKDYIKN